MNNVQILHIVPTVAKSATIEWLFPKWNNHLKRTAEKSSVVK